ncbi:hypothetical protein FVER53590_11130 [Fusarium verticillioides]|nr:hypothetical protein FVER53590_11130 [Fusarium verticillioides]
MDGSEQTSTSQIVALVCSILVCFASTIFFIPRNAILSRVGAAVALSCLQHSFYTSLLTSSLPPAQITGISLFGWGLYANATEQILLSRYDADDVLTVNEKQSGRHLSTVAHFLRAVAMYFNLRRVGLRGEVSMKHRVPTNSVSSAGNWVIGYVSVRLAHNFVAAVSVVLGLCKPEDWPHLNGPISSWSTVRTFWGTFWHRLFRKALAGWGDFIPDKVLQLRRGTLLSRYTRLTLAFFASGLMHRCVHYFYRLEAGERQGLCLFYLDPSPRDGAWACGVYCKNDRTKICTTVHPSKFTNDMLGANPDGERYAIGKCQCDTSAADFLATATVNFTARNLREIGDVRCEIMNVMKEAVFASTYAIPGVGPVATAARTVAKESCNFRRDDDLLNKGFGISEAAPDEF